MMPPHVDGCRPDTGSLLGENLIRLYGNGFHYIGKAPQLVLLPSNTMVDIEWRYQYDLHHPRGGQAGGVSPSEMEIWIGRLEPGARYRLTYHDFSAEFTAGRVVRYLSPPKEEEGGGFFRTFFRRFGRFGK